MFPNSKIVLKCGVGNDSTTVGGNFEGIFCLHSVGGGIPPKSTYLGDFLSHPFVIIVELY